MEEPLRYEVLTGLSYGQLHELAARIAERRGDVVRPGGPPGLDRLVPVGGHGRGADAHQHHPGGGRGHLRGQPADREQALGPAAAAHRPGARGAGSAASGDPGEEGDGPWWTAPSRPPGTGRPSRTCTPARPGTPASTSRSPPPST